MKFPWRKSSHIEAGEYPYVGRISAGSYREAAANPFVKKLIERAAKKAAREDRAHP